MRGSIINFLVGFTILMILAVVFLPDVISIKENTMSVNEQSLSKDRELELAINSILE